MAGAPSVSRPARRPAARDGGGSRLLCVHDFPPTRTSWSSPLFRGGRCPQPQVVPRPAELCHHVGVRQVRRTLSNRGGTMSSDSNQPTPTPAPTPAPTPPPSLTPAPAPAPAPEDGKFGRVAPGLWALGRVHRRAGAGARVCRTAVADPGLERRQGPALFGALASLLVAVVTAYFWHSGHATGGHTWRSSRHHQNQPARRSSARARPSSRRVRHRCRWTLRSSRQMLRSTRRTPRPAR